MATDRYFTEMKNYYWPILFFIVMLGVFLRFVNLETNPPHLGNDEISIAYDSYSVRLIGKDEHGYFWPISFKSHQTYKAPLYAYLNVPFNLMLGNSEYGVRSLSAMAGCLSVIFVALIGMTIGGTNISLLSALLMATDPKSIFASRIAFESNLAATVLLAGLWCLLQFVTTRKNWWLIFGGLLLGFSIWGYHTEWGLVPLLLLIIPFVFRKQISIISWWPTILIVVLMVIPILYDFVVIQRADLNNRANSQLWFSDGKFKDYMSNSSDSRLKKSIKFVTTPIYSYIEHFGLAVNFTSGADLFNDRSPLNSGWYLLATLPMLLFGLKYGSSLFGKYWNFLLGWWLLCPIIPAMTGYVASVRNLPFIAPSCLIMACGCVVIFNKFKIIRWLMIVVFLTGLGMFCVAYFVHYRKDSGNNFQYGYKQAWEFIKPNIDKYKKVVIENRFGPVGQYVGVPHLYFGYYGAFNVNDMQQRRDKDGLKIGKFEFKYVDWNQEVYQPDTVYVVSAINPKAGSFYNNLVLVGMIRNVDFDPQFLIYETIK